ncbi:DUF935 domain-containing protein [Desulfovulcanus sp.]
MRTPTLYDYAGRPIKKSDLKGEQGAPTLGGVRSYATLLPASSYTPTKLARVLKEAAAGDILSQCELFDDLEEKDTHIFAEMGKRRRAVCSLTWQIHPYDDSARADEIAGFVEGNLLKLLDRPSNLDEIGTMSGLFFALTDGIGRSLSCVELIWDISESQYYIKSIKHRPLAWFMFHPEREGELRLVDGSGFGQELIPGKWIVHFHPAKSGSPYRAALYRILAWLYLFRNYDLKAWVQFLETFGIPLRIGKYPPGSTEKEQDILLEAVTNIATDAAVIIPDGMAIDVLNVVRSAAGNPHKTLMDWSEKEISKAILGATLTSTVDGKGSYAAANVHNEVRLDILEADTELIAGSINQHLIRPLVQLNFGPDAPVPYLQFDIPRPDKRELDAEIVSKLIDRGFTEIPLSWLREKFNIPKPQKGDRTLADLLREQASPEPENRGSGETENRGTGERETNSGNAWQRHLNKEEYPDVENSQAAIDNLSQAITDQDFETLLNPVLKPVFDLVQNSASFEDIMENLASAYPEMDSDSLQELLQKAIFLSELWGMMNG